ncbi:receptor-type tyrosine-protein phosphatase epsilon-like [Physella acuta]|uniref:receptor-type tyrosine-protein phosphatase epsilon-like n=1 Tax=Physella acuta TaxID=109671 RepID=UPI0027DDD0B5|nr:receptor-type tyrosine-protein phosphatase epsilon-like [Physella acuta]
MGEYCVEDCGVGKYGHNCNSTCSVNCTQSQCNVTNGHCFKCRSGYQGEFCDQVCDDGSYGDGCLNKCSTLCVVNATESRCNNTDGACLIGCNQGFTRKNEECSLFFHLLPVDQETPLAAIVVPILAVLIIAALCIVGFLLWRRRRSNEGKSTDTSSIDGELSAKSESEMVTLNGVGIKLQDTKRFSKPVAVVNAYCNTIEFNDREILVSQLHEFMQTHNIQYFGEEFYKIPSPQNVSSLIGLSVANKSKNRYKNICTYDHSRVHLEINTNKNEGDYINASYIEGYNNEEKFIASQGPNEASINDFVRMLWEQKVDKVVMLANLIEEGKEKCSRYWPTEGSIKFGDIKVKLATTHVFADYTLRKLELSKKNQTSHQFTQFHFTSWPDKGVPLTPWGLVDFEQRVALGSTSRPIVVHCSAGVGRTGTFIALRNVMREAEDTGRINCFQTVAKLRQDRMLMVQTAEQYQFLHKAAQVAIVCLGTTVSSNDIVDRIQKLSELSLMKRSNMEEEFNAVSVLSEDFSTIKEDNDTNCEENVYQNNVSENVTKNRYPSIVPSTPHRAVLSCESRDLDNYINAVLVPSFTKRENQILTQLPMPNTVTDFWRLVAQYNVKLVVAFQTLNQDQTLGQYLPANMTTPLDCGPYEIHTGPVKSESLWEEQQITVKVVKTLAIFLPSNVISETHVTYIASKSTDLNPKNLLKLLKHTRSNNVQAQGRVLYMCRNGAEYSGLACVLSLLLDRMDHDQSLTVPLVVGAIKCIRPQVIPSLEQYRCLYKVLERHNEINTPYNNFANYSSAKPNHDVTPPTVEENIYANS